jgi:hypothetical protein
LAKKKMTCFTYEKPDEDSFFKGVLMLLKISLVY